jgi:hypothetical protein
MFVIRIVTVRSHDAPEYPNRRDHAGRLRPDSSIVYYLRLLPGSFKRPAALRGTFNMNYNHPPSIAHHMAPAIPGASHWHALATAYGIMDLIGAFGLFSVLVASFFTKRLRRNPVLLNFHLLFFVTALGGSLMVLAGRAFDQHPPRRNMHRKWHLHFCSCDGQSRSSLCAHVSGAT